MSKANPRPIKRGEVWIVNFDPTIGTEIRKTRPALVVSSDGVGRLPIKLIARITDWKPSFAPNIWHVRIDPDSRNRHSKVSAVDRLQLRGVDMQRFVDRLGDVSTDVLDEVIMAIGAVVEYP